MKPQTLDPKTITKKKLKDLYGEGSIFYMVMLAYFSKYIIDFEDMREEVEA